MAEFFSYCDLADVEGTVQLKFGPEDRPSRAEATRIIRGVAAEIDGVLEAAGYTLPIPQSATRSLDMLKHYNILGGAYRCWYAAFRGSQDMTSPPTWREDYKDFLMGLRKNEIALPDAPAGTESDQFEASITAIVTTC